MTTRLTPVLRHLRRLAAPVGAPADADAALLDRFVRLRDEDAFAALVTRHGPMVWNVARRVLADAHAAQDVMQATFLVLARKAASLRHPIALASWLYGVAYRTARGARRRLARHQAQALPEGEAAPPAAAADPLAHVTGRELLRALEEEVQRLPAAYRLVVILVCLEGLSREEAAHRLGCTPGSVKGRLERGRRRLHQRLTKRGLALAAVLAAVEVSRAPVRAGLTAATARAAVALGAGKPVAGCGLSARVNDLMAGALPAAAVGKLKVVMILAVALGAAALGAGVVGQPQPPKQPAVAANQAPQDAGPPKPVATRQARTDRYGDPLPPDALLRLGTVRHRYAHYASLRQPLPDGKTLLVSSPTEVRWVDGATGRRLDSCPLPRDGKVCGFSPDGRLALLFDGKSLRLWSLTARKELRTFQAKGRLGLHIDEVHFAPDGKLVATNSGVNLNPGLVRVWEIATGQELWQEGVMGFYDRGLYPLGFLPDGQTLVVLDRSSNRISLRDRTTGRERRSFATMPRNDSRSWRLSPDGKTFLFGTAGTAVRAWDVASGKELPPLGGHKGQAHTFAISPDSKVVLTGGQDSVVLVWDWPAGKRRGQIDLGQGRSVGSLAVSADGKRAELIVWGEDALRFFDLRSGKELPAPSEAHRASVNGVAVTPDGQVVSAGTDDTLRVWDLRSGRQLREIRTGHPLGATALALSADGRLVATSDINSGKILVHERATGRLLRAIDTGRHGAGGLTFAPRGRLLAGLAFAGNPARGTPPARRHLGLWDADTGRVVRRLEDVGGQPAFSPDGRLLAAADAKQVRLWEIASGRERHGLPQRHYFGCGFSHDGRVLACWDREAVTFWELAAGQERCRIDAPGKWVMALRFAPGGRWLAIGDASEVLLADVLHGQAVQVFRGHDHWVENLAFAPDGRVLVSAGTDTTLLVWDVAAVAARQPRPASAPDAKAVAAAWDDLAGADAKAAYRAIRLLAESPAQAVPLLRARLRPAPATEAKRIDKLLALLDSAHFAERDRAVRELEGLGDRAEEALRRFVAGGASLEAQRRAERLLARLVGPVTDRDLLRALRAVEVLEWAATPEARHVLERLAAGAPEARLTREARAALGRLTRRPVSAP
jgi:RNA polymerase sigma factor (sigma-70 family)